MYGAFDIKYNPIYFAESEIVVSYKSMRVLTSIGAGALLVAGYLAYALGGDAPKSFQAWAIAMLIFSAIAIVALIVIQILFHIVASIGIAVTERDGDGHNVKRILAASMIDDERDKLIGLKSARIGFVASGLGFLATLVAIALGASAVLALHVLFGSVVVGSIAGGIASVYYYQSGNRRG